MCTKAYLANGKDGYDMLQGQRIVRDTECCPQFPAIARHHFMVLEALNKWQAAVAQRALRFSKAQVAQKFLDALAKKRSEVQNAAGLGELCDQYALDE